jgi:hypothetical protein
MLSDDLELEGDHADLMALILKESSRVNTIINDFLAYSRMRPITRRRFPAREFGDEITTDPAFGRLTAEIQQAIEDEAAISTRFGDLLESL